MPLIPKPNYNQIFASQAPEQDKPAVFNNYPEGWGPESRPNNGKPTIKGFNYLQQTSDLKDLWILQNGACLPYDESIEYAEGAPVLKDGVIQYKTLDGFKSRDSVTIPTYNSAADGVDPVTGVADGAYFNVRSTDEDAMLVEYQNVGGSAVATGKRYLSSLGVQLQEKAASTIKDANGKDQQQINTFYEGAFQFVDNWGAKGDGVTQDRAAIQSAINAAHAQYLITGTPVTLLYRDGATYVCHSVYIKEGVNHVCYGTARILKTPAAPEDSESSLNWRNIFALTTISSSASLKDRVWFSGLIFDGNYNNMNWTWGSYNQQQAGCVYLASATTPVGKRFKIGFDRVKFIDSVGDGILVARDIDLKVRGVEGENCFRGGITLVGGNTLVDINGYTGNNANFHVEVDGKGNDNSYRIIGDVSNVEIDAVNGRAAVWGGFYFVAGAGTNLTFNNFKCHSTGFGIESTILGGDLSNTTESKLVFNNSFFTVGYNINSSRYYFPRNTDFNNVEFLYTMPDDASANHGGTSFYWRTISGSAPPNQVLNYNNCKFIGEVKNGFKRTAAFQVDSTPNTLAGVINFNNCESSGMRITLLSQIGYRGRFSKCRFDTDIALIVGSSTYFDGCDLNIEMEHLSFGTNCTSALRITDSKNDGTTRIVFGDGVVAKKTQVTTADVDFTNINGVVEGGMTLLSEIPPNASTNNSDVRYLTGTEWVVTSNTLDGKPKRYKNFGTMGVRAKDGWRAMAWTPLSGATSARPVLTKFDVGVTYINTETSKVDTWTGSAWI